MSAEETQERGREGVFKFKRWLESSTFLDLMWNAYANPEMCEVQHMDGVKTFDLAGSFLTRPNRPVAVECKRYGSAGNQSQEYEELLAIAYGSALWNMKNGRRDDFRQYIWATTHPFSITNWSKLTRIESLRDAVSKHRNLAGEEAFDDDLGHRVMDRIWLLVWHEKQEQITLDTSEVLQIWNLLDRKETML